MFFVYLFHCVNNAMDANTENGLKLREIVLNTRKPIVFRNFQHKWKCFENGISQWCKVLDHSSESKPYFERILISDAFEPQWERKRQLLQLFASEFLQVHSEEQNFWSGMNYKRKHELPVECTEGLDFGCFGFAQATDDCTFWFSSRGANTPCHYDTYGCNIVVQVFGRKSWLFFPPGAHLTPTRIPYEESSIYCKENFYAPNENDKAFLDSQRAQIYHCVLEPNDVLIVPKHWWHFVEALEISLSVNAWIPLVCDVEDQIEECIAKHLVENFVKDKCGQIKEYVLNPNQLSDKTSDEDLFGVLEYLMEEKKSYDNGGVAAKKNCSKYEYQYLAEDKLKCLIDETANAMQEVPLLTDENFQTILNTNGNRFQESNCNNTNSKKPLDHIQEQLFDSICCQNVIQKIKQEFFNRYNWKS